MVKRRSNLPEPVLEKNAGLIVKQADLGTLGLGQRCPRAPARHQYCLCESQAPRAVCRSSDAKVEFLRDMDDMGIGGKRGKIVQKKEWERGDP